MDLRQLTTACLTLLLALATPLGTAAPTDRWQRPALGAVLKVDDAFRLMPVEAQGRTVRVQWEIAPGYYLYLNRLQFSTPDIGVQLGAPRLPPGEKHRDEHFGEVVIQRAGVLTAEIPANRVPASLTLTYQGCAESGVCLPPQTRQVPVTRLP